MSTRPEMTPADKWLKCPLCGYRSHGFTLMARHLQNEHWLSSTCQWCGYQADYNCAFNLGQHLRTVGSLRSHYTAHLLSKVDG